MRPFAIPVFGLLAVGALIIADLNPLAKVVETNMVVRLPQTTWGGGGRMWFGAGLMVMATLFWAFNSRRWPIFFSGACLGLLGDIVFSAVQWRQEKFAQLKMMGLEGFEPTIQWQMGTVAYLAALVFVIGFFVKSAYPVRPPVPQRSSHAAVEGAVLPG